MFIKAEIIVTQDRRTNVSIFPLTSIIRIYKWNNGYNIELINGKTLEAVNVEKVVELTF